MEKGEAKEAKKKRPRNDEQKKFSYVNIFSLLIKQYS